MLYTSVFAGDESGHAVLMAGVVAVAALVVLACRLPGDSEPGGDLWPPDAQIDGMVDEHREFRLCLVPREPGVLDLLEHLGCRPVGIPLRRACRFAGACSRHGGTCLTLGPNRRFDLLMESSMRPRCDNSGRHWSEGDSQWLPHPLLISCELHHIIPGIAVAGGR